MRTSFALLSAAFAASLLALIELNAFLLAYSFAIALLHVLILGLPIYFILKQKYELTFLRSTLAGLLIGLLPATIIIITLSLVAGPDWAMADGIDTVVNGKTTLYGWLTRFEAALMFGVSGALGGAAFFYVMKRAKSAWKNSVFTPLGTIFCLATGYHVFVLSSCHYRWLLSGGDTSPKMTFQLDIPESEFTKLESVLDKFAKDQKWSLKSDLNHNFPGDTWFQYSICDSEGSIIAGDHVFKKMYFHAYQPHGGDGWKMPYRTLYSRLDRTWPEKIVFSDNNAQLIPPPKWIKEPIAVKRSP